MTCDGTACKRRPAACTVRGMRPGVSFDLAMGMLVTRHTSATAESETPLFRTFTLAYLLLLVYGSLFPLNGWDWQRGGLAVLSAGAPSSRSDIITNLVIYIPLGLLLTRTWHRRLADGALGIVLVALCGTLLSLGLEYLQSYLPTRIPSLLDTALNGAGTLLGALLARGLTAHSTLGTELSHLHRRLIIPGPTADLGLAVLGLWALAQLAPWVPSLDRGTLVQGIQPLRHMVEFHAGEALGYALNIAALGLLALGLIRTERRPLLIFAAFTGVILLLKIPVVGRQLSWEAVVGAGAALGVLPFLRTRAPNVRPFIAGSLILLAYGLEQLHGSQAHGALRAFNWIPFRDQLESTAGLQDIVAKLWPFAAIAYWVLLQPARRRRGIKLGGALLIFILALALEGAQTRLPGRYPNITDACLAVLGWWLTWLFPLRESAGEGVPTAPAPSADGTSQRRARLAMVLIAAALAIGWGLTPSTPTSLPDRPSPPSPAPGALAAVSLPNFHYAHPRLPAPSAADIARLRKEHPAYLTRQLHHADSKHLNPAILMAYIQPGRQDLSALHQSLMALKFVYRGNDQTKPLAMAYDWLYDQWTEPQRAQLRGKLADACEYQIDYIRKHALSPYNVYLYNSPLQALMACAISLYGDDPRGDPVMAFTSDMLKNRVLPVWRQIMGKHGGWHEGGEYVGIGIGQAIYQLPAMWRKATGEDYFKTEPGIRGFLDFVIYRTRPDGTDFHWGDAGYFERAIPDLLPLSMEYQNSAAYSLRSTPAHPIPSSWPWGPLTDNRLYDPTAISKLPLSKYFDGIGMIIARSGWGPNATYVTFKAGDNYWSHSHLDQGAFTIYKGGALAIDSGLYGPSYDSDHHMNYSYQTIAHNLVTVTDPDDTIPAPAHRNRPPRPIANDGGQRRVGSGWGVEAAPLDIEEWRLKRGIYHTAKIEGLLIEDGLTAAEADLTPAYTNAFSGQGTFADRTRRVEDFHRFFGYDRDDDVIIIFDRVTASKAEFRKRWLLHTLEKPMVSAGGFLIRTPPEGRIGHAGGRLEGHVLLPRHSSIQLVGGEGHEYFIDGRNYDQGVAAKLKHRKNPEPGKWRIEIAPTESRNRDEFLIVMLPSLPDQTTRHKVRLLSDAPAGIVGMEVRGPRHTSRWYFARQGDGAHIEISNKDGTRSYHLHDSGSAPAGRHPHSIGDALSALFD